MRLPVDTHQVLNIEVGVPLRRAQTLMPQQFLNSPKVSAGLQEVRGEGVAECVRADPLRDGGFPDVPPDNPVDTARGQACATQIRNRGARGRR
jgi:hypothetical protein